MKAKARDTWVLLLICLLSLGLFAACGDDDDDNDDTADDDTAVDDDATDDDATDDDAGDDDDDDVVCPDADNDGFTDEACGGEDCDDADKNINPDAEEICGDNIDQDCDDVADDGCVSFVTETVVSEGYTCLDSIWTSIRCHHAAFHPLGYPVVAYYNQTAGDLVVAIRTGKGWDSETVDSEGDVGRDPWVAVDGNGRIAVAYWRVDTKEMKIAFKSQGGSWNVYSLGAHGGMFEAGGDPHLLFDAENKANLTSFKTTLLGSDIWYWVETTEGEWNSTMLFQWMTSYVSPYIALNSSGLPGMAWYNYSYETYMNDVYFGTFDLNAAANYYDIVTLSTDDASYPGIAFAYDANDIPHVFYSYDSPMDIVEATSDDNYATWNKVRVPDENEQLSGPIQTMLASDGGLWLSYASDFPLTPRLARYNGEDWTIWEVLDNDASEYGKRPSLAVDADGLPGVVYMYEPDAANGQLKFAQMVGVLEVK